MRASETLLLVLSSLFFSNVYSARRQIGYGPAKGGIWWPKNASGITVKASVAFRAFVASEDVTTARSLATNLTYYYSNLGRLYEQFDVDTTMCWFHFNSSQKSPLDEQISRKSHPAFTVYFVCDALCCAMECCEREPALTAIGMTLIATALLILLLYVCTHLVGCFFAIRNGSFNGKLTSASPSKNGDTAMVVIRNYSFR